MKKKKSRLKLAGTCFVISLLIFVVFKGMPKSTLTSWVFFLSLIFFLFALYNFFMEYRVLYTKQKHLKHNSYTIS